MTLCPRPTDFLSERGMPSMERYIKHGVSAWLVRPISIRARYLSTNKQASPDLCGSRRCHPHLLPTTHTQPPPPSITLHQHPPLCQASKQAASTWVRKRLNMHLASQNWLVLTHVCQNAQARVTTTTRRRAGPRGPPARRGLSPGSGRGVPGWHLSSCSFPVGTSGLCPWCWRLRLWGKRGGYDLPEDAAVTRLRLTSPIRRPLPLPIVFLIKSLD